MLPILIPRIPDQIFMEIDRTVLVKKNYNIRGLSPLLGGLQLSKEAEILRSSLIWCLVPMIQISSKSKVFDWYLNFEGELLPPFMPPGCAQIRE